MTLIAKGIFPLGRYGAEDARKQHPLFALSETRDPLIDFDIYGFTLQYEMSYTNVLNMLDLSGIPLTWKERDETIH